MSLLTRIGDKVFLTSPENEFQARIPDLARLMEQGDVTVPHERVVCFLAPNGDPITYDVKGQEDGYLILERPDLGVDLG